MSFEKPYQPENIPVEKEAFSITVIDPKEYCGAEEFSLLFKELRKKFPDGSKVKILKKMKLNGSLKFLVEHENEEGFFHVETIVIE